MWIIQEPKKVALWNKWHFEEEKTECVQHVWNIQYVYLLNKYIKCNVWRLAVRCDIYIYIYMSLDGSRLMCWLHAVPLHTVNYNRAFNHWDSEPVMNYMILCDAMQYVTWSWYRLVMTASAKIGLRLLTCSSLSTPYCWWVLHNPSACSQLSYQQAFTLGTSQFRVSLSPGYYSNEFCEG
jgi:hypothetical protein